MTSAEAVDAVDARGSPRRLARRGEVLRGLWPPLRSVRFWVVQATVLLIAALHDVVLVWLRAREGTLAVPGPVTAVLLFIPVLYAALNFGVQGAVGTAMLSTLIIVPHWFQISPRQPDARLDGDREPRPAQRRGRRRGRPRGARAWGS